MYCLTQDMDVLFMAVYLSLHLAETAAIVDFFSAAQSPKTYGRVLGRPIKKERKKISFGHALSEKKSKYNVKKKTF